MPDQRDSLREAVTGIWCAILGADHAAPDDDFFLAGGTSALAVEAAISLRALVGADLELDVLYQHPKLGGLLSFLTDPKPERQERPLTPAEERLWFAERLHPGTPRYNIAALYRFPGRIDVPRLRTALDALVTRHDSLRRGFEGAGRVVTAEQASVSCRWLDAVDLPEDTVRKLVDEQARLPFDLARPPLLRAMAVDRGGDGDLLLLTVHHLVCDGASLAILEDDLGRLYREGATAAPTEVTAEVSTVLLGEDESRAYWNRVLDGCPRGIALPHDLPRPAVLDGTGDVHALECAEDLLADMAKLAEQERLSPFMTWIVAYAVGLVAQTGERDVVLGIAASSRTAAERGEIGMFVNPLPLRVRVPEGVTTRELAGQVRKATVEALAHRGVPFQTLIEDLGPGGDLGRAPLVQAGLTYLDASDCVLRLDGQEAARDLLPTGTSKYELLWSVTKQAGRVLTEFEHLSGLFTTDGAATVHKGLLAAAGVAFARPDAPVRVAEVVVAQENWRPLPELIRAQATTRPDAPALRHHDVELTYRELDERAVAIASGLRAAGLTRGSVVAVPMARGIDSICAYVGIHYAGGAYLPLDPDQPAERTHTALHGVADAALVSGTPPVLPPELLVLQVENLLTTPSDPAVPVPVIGADPAYLIATSGSTGRPKTVVVPHRGLSRLVPDAEGVEYHAEDRVSHLCNPAFDASMLEIWGALGSGAVLVVGDKADALAPARLKEFLAANRISVVGLPTALLHSVIDFAPDAFRDVRLLVFGGEKADEQRMAKLLANEPPECVVNVYGPTENTTVSTLVAVTAAALEPGPLGIGRAITGSTAYALDADGALVPPGGEGELYVGGAGLALGYHGNPALTATVFVPDPFGDPGGRLYRTGDRVRPRADGTFLFVGRTDDQVKVRGFRVELGEIEHELKALPHVIDAVVFARSTADSVELLACVTGEPGLADSAALAEGLRDRLPAYMIPAIVCTDPFPLNANGKVDRPALLANLPTDLPTDLSAAPVEQAAADPLTEAVSVLWCESLGTTAAAPDENFVAKGGHSIKALKLLARVDETFGVAVELADFMAEPTLRGLVAAVARETD